MGNMMKKRMARILTGALTLLMLCGVSMNVLAENGGRGARDQNQYQCYSIRLNLTKCHARISYLNTRQAELEKRLDIEKRKLAIGYSTKLEVAAIQSEVDINRLDIQGVEEEAGLQKKLLALYGAEVVEVELPDTLEELGDGSNDGLDAGWLQGDSAQSDKAQLEMKIYRMQQETAYRQARLKVQEYDSAIALMEQRIENGRLLYEKGRLREVDIMELETEKERLVYERKSCICDALLESYELENL